MKHVACLALIADLADFIIWVVASRRGKFETLAFHASHNAHHFIQVGSEDSKERFNWVAYMNLECTYGTGSMNRYE